jgi:hypothetical protein
MGADVVRRPERPKPVMTAELRRRKRLSVWESFKAYTALWVAGLSVVVLAGSIVGADQSGGGWWAVPIVGSVLTLIWGLAWAFLGEDDPSITSMGERRKQVMYDRSRRRRRHWEDDLGRLAELKYAYARYSCIATRSGTDIRVDIVKHAPYSNRFPLLLRWKAAVTQEGYSDSTGHGRQATYTRLVNNPSIEAVQDALDQAYKIAESLENNAYAAALKYHRLDALALTVTPPPASEETHVSVHEELQRNGAARVGKKVDA